MIAMIQVEKQYASNLDKWCKEGVSDVEEGLNNFIQRTEDNLNIFLTYDNRISLAAKRLMNNFDYAEYSQKQQHKNVLKSNLAKILQMLYIESFISIEDYHKLTTTISSCFLSRDIDKFIDMVVFQQRELSSHEIETFWKNSVRRNFEYTWSYFNKSKIFDDKIIKLFEISQPIIKKCSLQKIQEINQYHDINKRIQFAKTLRIKDVHLSCLESKNEYKIKIENFITPKCLFLSKKMLNKAIQQIKSVVEIVLYRNFQEGVKYDLYGSLRTGFALLFHSDADISINYQESCRQRKIMKLKDIYDTLKSDGDALDYFKIQLLASSKIRNPLVKINFDTKKDYNDRGPLSSVDILINSPIGLQNSKILEFYSKSIPIMKLVCLIKYWAKRKNLINSKRFSSYGITLMVLYFLIKTNQAPYIIKSSQSYRLQKTLLPDKQFTPLLENFVAFLDFYRYQGYFFTQKKPVCLMQMNGIETNEDILINMHDFIDGSNPGRVTKIIEQKFFSTINRTIQKLRLCIDLFDVFAYEE